MVSLYVPVASAAITRRWILYNADGLQPTKDTHRRKTNSFSCQEIVMNILLKNPLSTAEIACNILQPQKVRLVYYCTSTKICLFLLHFFYAEWHWSNFHKLLVLWIDGGGTGDTLRFAGLWSSRQARSILSAPWTDRCFAEGEGMGSVRTHNTHLPPRDTLDEIWWYQYSVRQDKIIVLWTVVNYN